MASSPRTVPPPPREPFLRRLEHFWERVTEGLELNQLWGQFKADARTSYRLYARDVEAKGIDRTQRHGWWAVTKEFFWAIMMKLSPARRVILLIALVLLVFPHERVQWKNGSFDSTGWTGLAALLLLLLLVLEIADRVVMKRDLEIAREIQSWLVPSTPPTVPGMDVAFVTRPANTVAGDYYDVFPIRSNGSSRRVLLAVADVAGKSIPAALLMATFQASLQTLAPASGSVLELVQGMNRYACAHSSGGRRFTTAFLSEFDPDTRQLTYVNAGHNEPVLRRSSGAVQRLKTGGLPLGIQPDVQYQCGTEQLQAGDLLFIFTDGLPEAENDRSEEYGEARMLAVLGRSGASSASDVIRDLMMSVNTFVGMASQHDDITCLAARIQ